MENTQLKAFEKMVLGLTTQSVVQEAMLMALMASHPNKAELKDYVDQQIASAKANLAINRIAIGHDEKTVRDIENEFDRWLQYAKRLAEIARG